jgi:hypothetical protein
MTEATKAVSKIMNLISALPEVQQAVVIRLLTESFKELKLDAEKDSDKGESPQTGSKASP